MHPGPDLPDGIRRHALPAGENPFAELLGSVRWEEAGRGRRAAVIVRVGEDGGVPLVRTTARYAHPAQRFRPVHERLAGEVREHAALPDGLDNALVEVYTNACTGMGAHSDLALDLAEGSSVALYSCYRDPAGPPRTLRFEPKDGVPGEGFGVPLAHHGLVVFSLAANRRFRHRIVLEPPARAVDNEWLGVTFRTSATPVHHRDGRAHLPDGELLPATEEQQREFHLLRRRENRETDFGYPPLAYTVSASDLLPPV
ncbi:hypothetical protein HUT16_36110 [Kitasatospora sp. NA04385]|uniref:hypothetical protein n=1 Tax=Kitasatospora sp. NA04385 TaxID=2742135 RepID=UPI001591298D|nr:hypothetical protein [Kitasatospora sp. NA04385]QKW23810.1 hypothetical protein HUT16_36110 [Kitasatospora sp. NA04385]